MKLSVKSQNMMDILEEYFSNVSFPDPVAILRYGDKVARVTQEIFNYDYGGGKKKEGPGSPQASEEHKILSEFLKGIIEPDDVTVEIDISDEDGIEEGFELIMSGKEDDECLFENLC